MRPNKRIAKMWRAVAEGKPELLDDLALQQRKPRAKPVQSEKKEVQQPLVAYLRKHLPLGSIVHAEAIQPVSENHRFAMQRDGVQFGMPDIVVIVPEISLFERGITLVCPRHYYIECKRPGKGGKLSPSQIHTQGLLEDMGCNVLRECRSVAQAVEWLTADGVKFR